MRWAIVGAAATCVLSAGILYGWMATTNTGDAPDWRTRDLQFLKSVHDRMQADLARHPGGESEASLRREQQSLLQSMAAVAKPMPAGAIPADVRPLLPPVGAPRVMLLSAMSDVATTTPVSDLSDLRVGPAAARLPRLDLTDMSVDAELRAPLPRKVAVKRAADKADGEKPAADRKAKDRHASDKSAGDKPAGDKPAAKPASREAATPAADRTQSD